MCHCLANRHPRLEHLKEKAKAYGLSNAVPAHSDRHYSQTVHLKVVQRSLKAFYCLLNRYLVVVSVSARIQQGRKWCHVWRRTLTLCNQPHDVVLSGPCVQWPMWSVQKRTSSLSGGSLTPNLTWSAWVTGVGCRCHRSMLNPLYGHLSITHSAIPIPTHWLNSQFRGQGLCQVGDWPPTSLWTLLGGLVMSHWVHSSVNSHDLWPVLWCGGVFSLCIRQLGLLRCVVKVLAIMCCHGNSLKELVCVWLWVVVH